MEINIRMFGIDFPSSFFTMVLLFVGLIIFVLFLNKKVKNMDPTNVKSPINIAVESMFSFFENMVSGILGKEAADKITPIIMVLFLSIFLGNMSAMIVLKEVAYDSAFPIVWGIIMFLVWNGYAIKKIGFKHFMQHFAKPNIAFLPIELLGFVSKLFSIMIRLLGNIASGVVLMMLVWMIPEKLAENSEILAYASGIFIIPLAIVLTFYFAIFAPFIQAYVFSMLSLGNIAMLIGDQEEEEEEKISLEESLEIIKEEKNIIMEER